jgi:hypothetical protein
MSIQMRLPALAGAFALAVCTSSLARAQDGASCPPPGNCDTNTCPQSVSGAIFTSDVTGTQVNQNLYDDKCDVYLNGGPPPNAPCSSGGLPDGCYYFQVTSPSGQTLLSTDPIDQRLVRAAGGVFVEYLGTSSTCTHELGLGQCADTNPCNISIQLAPYLDTPNNGGVYKVWVTPAGCYSPGEGFFGFLPGKSKTDVFKVQDCLGCPPPPPDCDIGAFKFYDTNANGFVDPGEPPIAGWRIEFTCLYGPSCPLEPPTCLFTDENGFAVKFVPDDGNQTAYLVTEVPPGGGFYPSGSWIPTTQTSGTPWCHERVRFGNVCVGPGGGKTLGYWSNKNGRDQMLDGGSAAPELTLLNSLCLRTENGSDADFSLNQPGLVGYGQFRAWILGANGTNMAYQLSAQLAAMVLNVEAGFVQGSSLVYAPGTQSANSAGFATVDALIAEANAELCAHPLALAGSPWRDYQTALKDALDRANNNQTFLQSGPCEFDSPYGPMCD